MAADLREPLAAIAILALLSGEAGAGRAPVKPNRLAREKSPYLLQHADNPVDWYPWGEEAFQKARKENKPVFLSIGYSTCHWCHVMEEESFVDGKIAAILNRHFVAVKVDREERPDVDKVYMTAAQGAGWGGGWPLSLWLTPDLKPFYGGTYFPPTPRWGQPAFPDVLERIAELWRTKREALAGDADRLAGALKDFVAVRGQGAKLDAAWLEAGFKAFQDSFEPSRGGFGTAPKFPMPVNHNFLLRRYARTGEKKVLDMVQFSLREMAKGGIHDHAGGGFHRYSTDAEWRVPHFEKMLYDNAQIAINYLEAYQATRDPELARVARETLGYVLRDMTHPEGGFYSAEDADSLPPELAGRKEGGRKTEGAFYLWTADEIRELLGERDAELFAYRYGVEPGGNAPQDPHGEFKGKNILYAAHAVEETAKRFSLGAGDAERRLKAALGKLLAARSKRPRPGLDDKVLASWNGLMISALARGAQVLEETRYLTAAEKAASFLRAKLYDAKARRLYHRWREGERAVEGIADDYAFMVQGLLDLFEASSDPDWLEWALELARTETELFYDKAAGGFYMTAEGHDPRLLVRVMEDADNVEPCASSVSALNLLRLWQLTGRGEFREAAERTLERFGPRMRDFPPALPQMLVALDFATAKPRQIVVAGGPESPGVRAMLRAVHARFLPVKFVLAVPEGEAKGRLVKRMPFLKGIVPAGGKPTAYVCENYQCKLPVTEVAALERILDGEDPSP